MSTLATQIRDAAFNRIQKAMRVDFKSLRKAPFPTFQTDQLPALGVYLLREDMTPNGDPNVGEPNFKVEATLGISILDDASSEDVLDGRVDKLLDRVEDTLFKDGTFVRLRTPDAPTGTPLLEGFTRVTRTPTYHKDGESYYLEMRLQISCQFRCYYPPNAPNALTQVGVTVQPFGPGATSQTGDTLTTEIDLPGS